VQFANRLGMKVTVFAMSGRVGLPGYLTAAQLRSIQAAGNEIGGHTINHPDLSALPAAAQRYEICDDRAALERDGLRVTDFAYPYGDWNSATPGIVRACGYQSARIAGGIRSPNGCDGPCPVVESIPPRRPWFTRTVASVIVSTSLRTMEGYVRAAERHGGGWLQIVFHYVCDQCNLYSVTAPTLERFVAWLARRHDIVERTIRAVIEAPFRAGRIRLTAGSSRSGRIRPALRCPLTPVTARCRTRRHAATAVLAVAAGLPVTVITGRPATRVVLVFGRRRIPARAVGRSRRRFVLVLPRALLGGSGAAVVRYELGIARYRVRFVAAQ
jgi:Polysaccharide deacetylase